MFVWIRPDGAVCVVYEDGLRGLLALGRATICRASHVEPTPDGQWTADLDPMAGPVLGPFETRTAALEAERDWLEQHFTSGHPQTGEASCEPSRSLPPPPRPGTRPRVTPP
jgi:hypothetical protein